MPPQMESLRLRIVFKNGDILSDAQKSEGLERAWILIRQIGRDFKTVDALSNYISQTFNLHHSCPDGLFLCMDGFVLPPFESTDILKDKDIISVAKKGALAILGSETTDPVEGFEVVQEQPGNTGTLLLANEAFDSESEGCPVEGSHDEPLEEDERKRHKDNAYPEDETKISKKRKASEKLPDSKKKKKQSAPHENGNVAGEKSTSKKKKKLSELQEIAANDVHENVDLVEEKSTSKKKKRSEAHESAADDIHENGDLSGKKSNSKKKKSSKKTQTIENGDEEMVMDAESTPKSKPIENGDEEMVMDVESTPKSKRNEQARENGKDIDGNTNESEVTPKGPSRSARRKKAKRKWLQEMAKIKKKSVDSQDVQNWKEMQSSSGKKESISLSEKEGVGQQDKEGLGNPKGHQHWKQFGDNSRTWSKPEEEHQNLIKQGDSNRNGIAIQIRPGHIRFEPQEDDEDLVGRRNQAPAVPVDTFQWNGITSKKKGQRWGRDNSYVSHGNDYEQSKRGNKGKQWGGDEAFVCHEDDEQPKQGEQTECGRDKYPISHGNNNEQSKEENEMNVETTHTQSSQRMDFDKLPYLSNLPKEGDVIAYRLLELSSSWTPEMSSYRVGKVSRYDSESSKIMLMPLPEYPIVFEKSEEEEESAEQQDGNLYDEDGSLEIEFTSLLDVRVLKRGDLDPFASNGILDQSNGGSICVNMETPKVHVNNYESTDNVVQEANGLDQRKPGAQPPSGNGAALWEQFSDVLNAKKEALSKESSSSRSLWSHRVLKGSTLGPTMAFLRSENDKNKEITP